MNAGPTSMNAAHPLIGFGRVWHRRLRPVRHDFGYPSYFLMLPMRALRAQPSTSLKRNRFGALAFFDRDHGDGRGDALAWFDDMLAEHHVDGADGEIWLHTFPRVLGHVFNPVSFWYALRLDGSLAAVVAEVNNTFGERHCYLLTGQELGWDRPVMAKKVFHVSPFCKVDGHYRFRFRLNPGTALAPTYTMACVDHGDADGALLQTRVSGVLEPLNRRSARRAFFGMPLMTLFVVLLIHWQALHLALKRLPLQRRPAPPEHFVTR